MVVEVIDNEEKNRQMMRNFPVLAAALPVLIGSKGTKAKEIQTASGAKLNFDRERLVCSIKGRYNIWSARICLYHFSIQLFNVHSSEACLKAEELINLILLKENLQFISEENKKEDSIEVANDTAISERNQEVEINGKKIKVFTIH